MRVYASTNGDYIALIVRGQVARVVVFRALEERAINYE